MSDHPTFDPPTDPPVPAGPAYSPPTDSSTEPMPISPISPKGSPWKPAAIGFGSAAVLGAAIFGIVQLTGDDDHAATDIIATDITAPAVSVPAEVQAALDEAEQAAADAEAQADQVRDDVLASIPSVPSGEPSGSAAPGSAPADPADPSESDGDADVTLSIPGDVALTELSECLGLGDLLGALDFGQLGTPSTGSLPNFAELTPEELAELDVDELLEQVFGQIESDLPAGSLPFDMSILDQLDLGELGDLGELSPEELQELIESQLGDLTTLSSMPTMSLPPISVPALDELPTLDPAQVEECLADVAP